MNDEHETLYAIHEECQGEKQRYQIKSNIVSENKGKTVSLSHMIEKIVRSRRSINQVRLKSESVSSIRILWSVHERRGGPRSNTHGVLVDSEYDYKAIKSAVIFQ